MADLIERIWAKIQKAGPDECWVWTGGMGGKGQPKLETGSARRPLWEAVHQTALPRNRQVATTCKVPWCMNPAHLYLRPWQDDEARFWTHVKKADGDACWEWQSTFFSNGYATFKMQGKQRHASRVAYELTHGPVADPLLFICHRCDNPGCVNPGHLFLGTAKDNTDDMWKKGRGSSGERHSAIMREVHRQRRGLITAKAKP
jgi:hypothetical protein